MPTHQCTQEAELKRIRSAIDKLATSNAEIREKIFNGLSDAIAQLPAMRDDITWIKAKLNGNSSRRVVAQRGKEVAIMALIISVVSRWDDIARFIGRLF